MSIRSIASVFVATIALSACSKAPERNPLDVAATALGGASANVMAYSGTGRWFQFGQSAAPGQPWPAYQVTQFTALVDYGKSASRVQMTRKQEIETGRERPAPVEQRIEQFIVGNVAWNLPTTGTPVPQPQPAAVAERLAEIWTTPHGFVRAARASNPTVTAGDGGESRVEFTLAGRRYEGTIDAKGHVERVRTWIDNPVLGDTPYEVTYADYRPFDDLMFPSRITRSLGGHPILELNVVSAATSGMTLPPVPPEASAEPAPVAVTSETLAPGVFYLRGGTHHSVAVDQAEGVVVVEGPQSEERSSAVIAKVKELIPNKPIRFVVNSHQHFDHSGGLRTYVDEGATVVTHEANRAFYESAWAAPRTIAPDRLAQSGKAPQFQTFTDKLVLDDKAHPVEVHLIAGNGHNDAFALVWLPRERILIEGDAWTPAAAGTPAPTTANPFTRNLLENVQRLKLDVRQIAALHGPRVGTLQELRAAANAGR